MLRKYKKELIKIAKCKSKNKETCPKTSRKSKKENKDLEMRPRKNNKKMPKKENKEWKIMKREAESIGNLMSNLNNKRLIKEEKPLPLLAFMYLHNLKFF